MMKHIFIFFFALLMFACTAPATVMQKSDTIAIPDPIPITNPIIESGLSAERMARFENYLKQEQADGNIPGAVCLVKKNGIVAYEKTIGNKEIGGAEPMPMDEIFYIQSMTKPIVTVAFMMLYEEGNFLLTDPIKKYLPQFESMQVASSQKKDEMKLEPAKTDITIRQVLSHTAGFSHGLSGSDLDNELAMALYFMPQDNIESRVASLAEKPLFFQPGERWHYSASPDILALLVEKFSGMSCADFLQSRLFDPLGMNDTGYNMKPGTEGRKAVLYQKGPDGKLLVGERQTPAQGHKVFGGTHGLFSTASDYMKFAEMLLNDGQANGKVFLSRKTIELMRADVLGEALSRKPGHGFGLGFGVVTDMGESMSLESTGSYYWGGAFNTYFFIDPAEDMVAVMMMQYAPYTDFYADKLRQFVYQAIVD